jgi:hypothetical protein
MTQLYIICDEDDEIAICLGKSAVLKWLALASKYS